MEQLLTPEIINLLFAAVGSFLGWWLRGGKSADDGGEESNPLLKLLMDRLRKRLAERQEQEMEVELASVVKELDLGSGSIKEKS